nr:hypothetical protein [Tanacetum cinerariifolium]
MNEKDMFGVNDLDGDEVIVDVTVDENVEQSTKDAKKEVSTADPVTTAGEVVTTAEDVKVTTSATTLQISKDELTLAQTLIEIKAAKPKAREVIVQEPSEFRTTSSSQPSQLPHAKDKEKTWKLCGVMSRKDLRDTEGKGFPGIITPLFETMMVQAPEEVGKGSEGRMNEKDMFGVNDLDGDEVIVDVTVDENVEQSTKDAKKEVSTADPVTTAGEVVTTAEDVKVTTSATTLQISKDELTLAQTLIEIKAAKPKAREVIVQEPSEFRTTSSSQPSQLPHAKDKDVPIQKNILHQMWNDVRLQADYEVKMACDLLRLIRR